MASTKRDGIRPWIPALVALGVMGLALGCRALGFADGAMLGATPASGLALAGALRARWRGALAAALGFAAAGAAGGLPPGAVAVDAATHGLAALAGAHAMRWLARQGPPATKTRERLIFLAGVGVFAATAAAVVFAGGLAGVLAAPPRPGVAAALAAVFEPLGVMTFGAVVFSLREIRAVLANPRPAFGIAALAAGLLAVLAMLLALATGPVRPSGLTLLASLPYCLWVAMQRRSLDGAAISFVAAHLALLLVLDRSGSVLHGDYVATIIYLDLLIAACQVVHAVNLDRVRALAELAAHERELEARVAERTARLSAMTERALAADAAKSKFVATVSHEVRTPLNGVIGMASVVLAHHLDPTTRANVEVIRRSGLHLLEVINRILDFSRLGHEAARERAVVFDLRQLVAEILGETRVAPHAAGLEFRAELDPQLVPFRIGDRQGLRQVLTNLVGNAAKFTDAGSITVRVSDGGGRMVRIEVADTGIGVPAAAQQRIFLPFEQADASMTRRFGGTGLGLAISAEVVARMGGRIGVQSAEGAGSVFWLELPLPLVDDAADPPLALEA